MFAIALGLSLDYGDDFFGDPRVPEYVATLLLLHLLILAPGHDSMLILYGRNADGKISTPGFSTDRPYE